MSTEASRDAPGNEAAGIPATADGLALLSENALEVLEHVDEDVLVDLREFMDNFQRFIMPYKFGIDQMMTKVSILREEFANLHSYNPIEHVTSRLKTADSLVQKAVRKGCDPTFDAIRGEIVDIAGVRVVCSFVSDVYRVFDLLTAQNDVRVVTVKDYIASPKPNGYQSLHAIVEIPVFLSTGPIPVPVEVQLRTVAMDFWASLEHKIYYKYDREVPGRLLDGLKEAAETASRLDARMERLHAAAHGTPLPPQPGPGGPVIV